MNPPNHAQIHCGLSFAIFGIFGYLGQHSKIIGSSLEIFDIFGHFRQDSEIVVTSSEIQLL